MFIALLVDSCLGYRLDYSQILKVIIFLQPCTIDEKVLALFNSCWELTVNRTGPVEWIDGPSALTKAPADAAATTSKVAGTKEPVPQGVGVPSTPEKSKMKPTTGSGTIASKRIVLCLEGGGTLTAALIQPPRKI